MLILTSVSDSYNFEKVPDAHIRQEKTDPDLDPIRTFKWTFKHVPHNHKKSLNFLKTERKIPLFMK